MSRRRTRKQDSLELLLDTICNTFGGVLFIAILVVMLLQQTGGAPAIPSPAPVSPVELQSLASQMESRWRTSNGCGRTARRSRPLHRTSRPRPFANCWPGGAR